jgi:hypothetical protein
MRCTLLRSLDRCIYCGDTDGLSDEHIVPAGLNGQYVLENASCERCRVEIGRFEGRYLNSIRPFRDAHRLGAGRQKARRQTAPLIATIDGKPQLVRLPFKDHPNVAELAVFRRAGVLARPYSDSSLQREGDPVQIGFGPNPLDVARRLGASEVGFVQNPHDEDFARMLAKIAYGHAVGRLGLDAFSRVTVLPAILGTASDIGRWVGTSRRSIGSAADPSVIHRLRLRLSEDPWHPAVHGLVVLFANAPSPEYEVVIGLLKPGAQIPGEFVAEAAGSR